MNALVHSEQERQRASRRRRIHGRGFRLQERDLDILLALAKMRLLSTSDIARLCFNASGTAQKRLRKLYDRGLVRTIVADLASENRYALTPFGHALLEQALEGEAIPPFRPAPRADAACVGHLDLLNRYRIALARGVTEHQLELVCFTPEWELRARDPQAEIVPDAAVVLGKNRARLEVALEVDIGTEPGRTVDKKLDRYESARLARRSVAGLRSPLVLLVTAKPRRALSLARIMDAARGKNLLLGSCPYVLEDGGITTGLSTMRQLATQDGRLDPGVFSFGLCRLLGG